MNNSADSCGREDGRRATNRLPGDGGVEQDHDTVRERNALLLHGEEVQLDAHDGGALGRKLKSGKVAENNGAGTGNRVNVGIEVNNDPAELAGIPEDVRATVAFKPGDYDARRLRSQREIIRDVMTSAADCETWLTLGELRALTRYGEASISAQLRHLRKTENGGYEVIKRHRDGASPARPGTDGRGECVWEYRITRGMHGIVTGAANSGTLDAVA